jgi:carboxymethylenebutenolidase
MLHDDLRQDFDALVPAQGASRRSALQLMLGAGYAAAAAPVVAQTAIKTPADGLTVGEVDYMVGGF